MEINITEKQIELVQESFAQVVPNAGDGDEKRRPGGCCSHLTPVPCVESGKATCVGGDLVFGFDYLSTPADETNF